MTDGDIGAHKQIEKLPRDNLIYTYMTNIVSFEFEQ